ncbi:OLC1v1006230C3 [Oldenlandia corymbosa var. corymbosa]|uniref:OLC1v1006230C3 n=1 Tax=Oldenlandia corymbosa var. corymbosa TaxID=529605 RepID=A0AAV1DGK8_OLDCO|nr:OLC1v1006230C3 [Oldenlandia corymbosa var. corymbosa]
MDVIAAEINVASDSVHDVPTPSSSSPAAAASSSRVQPRDAGNALRGGRQTQHLRQRDPPPASYYLNVSILQVGSASLRDEACAAFMVLVTFWIFACLTVILGFYGSSNLELGPNSSFLLYANPFFVQSIKVKELQESKHKPVLYGFDKPPPLDVKVKWSETHVTFVGPGDLKEWQYFLNKGSKVRISYSVKRPSSAALSLAIAEGRASLFDWIEDPASPNKTLSGDIIHGNGVVEQEIWNPETYFIALRNLNFEEVEVQLNFTIEALTYNATQANYECSISQQPCTLKLFHMGNTAVITSPGPESGMANYVWCVQLNYGHRWISYFVGSASVSVLIIVAMKLCFTFEFTGEYETRYRTRDRVSQRAPLLSQKDDDLSSWGSSESLSNDEDEFYESPLADGHEIIHGVSIQDKRRLCNLCLDAPRDCFFLPCGHCAACFTCGTRLVQLNDCS